MFLRLPGGTGVFSTWGFGYAVQAGGQDSLVVERAQPDFPSDVVGLACDVEVDVSLVFGVVFFTETGG